MSRLTINSNIASLNAQRNFGNATKKLSDSYTRLSSGLRINRAVDDAAGLSISESLKADTRIFNQGIRNLNDGASLLAIADGALNELSNITIRLRELATQSSNGTISNKQRLALDQEAQSLAKEYNRIARTTEFNGRKLFDGDFGDLSLAAGGSSNSVIQSGLGGGIGDGTFNQTVTYGVVLNLTNFKLEDIDADGNLDLVTVSAGSPALSVMKGNGDGSFKSVTVQGAAASNILDLEVRDFDYDGKLDAITVTDLGIVDFFKGNGDGTFNSKISYFAGGLGGIPNMTTGDINQDGSFDIIISNYFSTSIFVITGNSNGSFKSPISIISPDTLQTTLLTDINSDGHLDLITGSGSTNNLYQYLGNGDGSFKKEVSYAGTAASEMAAADFNNDGILDIAAAVEGSHSVNILFGNADGSLNYYKSYASGSNPRTMKLADFNGDGLTDIMSTNVVSNSVNIFIGNGDGSFRERTIYNSTSIGLVTQVGDLNNDGAVDIISGTSDRINVLLGNSNDGVSALQLFSLKTQYDSRSSLDFLNKVISRLSAQRGQIGAFQSRVETANNNLYQSSLAYSEASSRITDADIAEESSKLIANQIIQKAASGVLAQANLQPKLVLQLLSDF